MSGSSSASIHRVSEELVRELGAELEAKWGSDRVSRNLGIRQQHANTISLSLSQPPDLVVYPLTTDEVAEVVKACHSRSIPIIAFGAGTSFEGHLNAPHGGISIDLSRMKQVLAVNAEDLDCVVEPGITRKELNAHLRDSGLFFPIDPGADASVGGMVATRASGTNAVRYGTMKDNVLALKVVLADGSIVKTSSRARKSSAGYDLTRLFVGSEGTLGIITEVTLKLHGIPEAIGSGACSFPSVRAACDAAIAAIQSGIPIARVELLDAAQVRACNQYSKLTLPETPLLLVEFHGTAAGVTEQAEHFGQIAQELGSSPFQWSTQADERNRLWQARHDAYWAGLSLRPGSRGISTDVCVPISNLAQCVEETREDIDQCGMIATILGHVGDGNFHVIPLIDIDAPAEVEMCRQFLSRLTKRALKFDGTCTGEHGVGQQKIAYLEPELGSEAVQLMKILKRAIDPANIMNPGKILDLG